MVCFFGIHTISLKHNIIFNFTLILLKNGTNIKSYISALQPCHTIYGEGRRVRESWLKSMKVQMAGK